VKRLDVNYLHVDNYLPEEASQMAVFKRLVCVECKKVQEVKTLERKPTPCTCGGKREYGEKWIVSLPKKVVNGVEIPRYFKAYSTLKAEALTHEAEMKNRQAPAIESTSFESLADFFTDWCKTKVAEGSLGKLSAKSYMSRLNFHLIPYFKSYDPAAIDEETVEKYRLMRLKAALPASVNREVSALKRMLSLAAKRKKIAVNPIAGLEMLKENNKRERVLTLVEIKRLLAECANISGRCRIASMLALNTGLRVHGCLTLKWSEVNFDGNYIEKKVKGETVVKIPMSPDLLIALKVWLAGPDTDPCGYVIPSPRKDGAHMLVGSRFGFKSACIHAGLGAQFHFHDLRHTFATFFIRMTRDIHLTAKLLGHSTTYITERYAHLVDDQAETAMRGFSLQPVTVTVVEGDEVIVDDEV
jgi:integrase